PNECLTSTNIELFSVNLVGPPQQFHIDLYADASPDKTLLQPVIVADRLIGGGSSYRFSWTSDKLCSYSVHGRTNLFHGAWVPLATDIPATPPVNTIEIPIRRADDLRYFIVEYHP
ncbi:MAG: hypothetical protein AAF492_16755, partial [Verrucomicrobiota bacterium]